MRVSLVTAVFPPEPLVSGQVVFDLAEHLSQLGHDVTVVCPRPSRPMGGQFENYIEPLAHLPRVRTCRVVSYCAPSGGMLLRLRENLSFGRASIEVLDKLVRPDVVYANTWPLFAQSSIASWCVRSRVPAVLHIQDLYPESLLVKVPAPIAPLVEPVLLRVDKSAALRARRIVVPSDSMREVYVRSRGMDDTAVVVCRNWQDEKAFEVPRDRLANAHRYGVDAAAMTFLYLGNIGPVAGVEMLIAAFAKARLDRAQLVIAGSGSRKAECVRYSAALGAANVYFIEDANQSSSPDLLSLADVCMLPMRAGTGNSSIPSKLSGYLLAGKPVIATVDRDSDTAQCIRTAGCGWVGTPGDPEWLARQYESTARDPLDALRSLGANGRAYALKHLSKSAGVARLAEIVTETSRR